ncbi:PREDICTED: uncharacterized protein LOC109240307 [Nicotiana attenuata]|uniref:uncharacterized protein LOC109240307 n=1 Tax=Nicotiana attenuata TaxID=49451 RepID=UPI000904BD39|nr:PREDICTED: uncharacterized protein LOC109240307 [Nicotiana attenuata]
MVTVRTVFSIAASRGWDLFQMDVNNAFLQGDLYEDVYLELPQGFQRQGEYKVYKLLKSLYGLKQASRQWNIKLIEALVKAEYHQSANDHSLFTKYTTSDIVVILVYVDDLFITGSNAEIIKEAKQTIQNSFKVKDLGDKILLRTGTQSVYAATKEISLGCSVVSDWASCANTGRSVIGYVIKLGDSLLPWKSKKQQTVSRSSAEAGYRSFAAPAAEITWFLGLLKELHVQIQLPVSLHCDSKAEPYKHYKNEGLSQQHFLLPYIQCCWQKYFWQRQRSRYTPLQ